MGNNDISVGNGLILALGLVGMIVVSAAGCGNGEHEGATMMPGSACLSCHSPGSGDEGEEEPFTFAGTVYSGGTGTSGLDGAMISVTDAADQPVQVTSNSAGNFFYEEQVTLPLSDVTVTVGENSLKMMSPATNGNCNSCHAKDSTTGRIIGP